MSHVTLMDVEINDLEALKKAAANCGLEFVEQKTFKWYGYHVGDYPLPPGFTKADMGKCEYALRIPGNKDAYEVGIARRRDGKPGYVPLWDFWGGGFGLEERVGKEGLRLMDEYAAEVAIAELELAGHRAYRTVSTDGQIEVRAEVRLGGGR